MILCLLAAMPLAALGATGGTVNIGAVIDSSSGGGGDIDPPPAPVISLSIANAASSASCGSAQLSWDTTLTTDGNPAPASSYGYVEYWITGQESNKLRIDVNNPASSHLVNLSGLIPISDYSYNIHAQSAAYSADAVGTFRTECSLPAPRLSLSIESSKALRLDIAYPNYNDIVRLAVYRGQADCTGNDYAYQSLQSKAASSTESLTIDSVTAAGTVYDYTACIYNSAGVHSSAYAAYSRSLLDIAGATAVPGNRQVSVSWTNPSSSPAVGFAFAAARLIRVAGACSASTGIGGGTLLYEGVGSSFTDSGLANGTTYNYKLFAKNSFGEYSSGVCLSAKPTAPAEGRCMTGVGASAALGQANFSWTNPANEADVFELDGIVWKRGTACVTTPVGQTVYSGTGTGFANPLAEGQLAYYSAFVNYNGGQTISCGCWPLSWETITDPEKPDPDPDNPDPPPPPVCVNCGVTPQAPDFQFYVYGGSLRIYPRDGVLRILSGSRLTVKASQSKTGESYDKILATIDDANSFLALDNASKSFSVTLDPSTGRNALWLSTVYANGTENKVSFVVEVAPLGKASPAEDFPEAVISLLKDGSIFLLAGLVNPQAVGNGSYGFMVPPGNYQLVAASGDDILYQSDVSASEGIVNRDIVLKRPNVVEEVISGAVSTTIAAILPPETQKAIVETAKQATKAVQDTIAKPEVQTANKAAAPAVAAVATVNLAVAVPWWNFWYYLQYLFTEFIPWIMMRRRKGWGVVYNSITKKPVDLAAVRLYDAVTNKLIKTRITDKRGRYLFLVEPGSYYIKVDKPQFDYPSQLLRGVSQDKQYADIYHGEVIKVGEDGKGAIIANIPLDQHEAKASDVQLIRDFFWGNFRKNLAFIGPALSLIALIVSPSWLMLGLTVFHVVLLLFFKRLADKGRVKYWGVVYDADNRKPLKNAVARIYAPEYGRMLEAYVTDRYGRYGFLAEGGTFYITGEKPGYLAYKTDNLDLSGSRANEVVGKDLPLKGAGGNAENEESHEVQEEGIYG